MHKPCVVCAHEDLDEIDGRLIRGDTAEDVASDYALSKRDLLRHKVLHISKEEMSEDSESEEIYCEYCERPLDEDEIEEIVIVGEGDYRPICGDCAAEEYEDEILEDCDIDE